ncbi:hypothetical protein AVEN_136562-1 [Araneus ventricosus]|uniref:Uncharacterized protein n=1 Tax=Araneus ventricosus TaxID=182803 RepID=A0A4Y2JRL1_ARAVE|nr:hypothetical protein AVEN_136562-1 [Araneus ventricosus]
MCTTTNFQTRITENLQSNRHLNWQRTLRASAKPTGGRWVYDDQFPDKNHGESSIKSTPELATHTSSFKQNQLVEVMCTTTSFQTRVNLFIKAHI